MNTPPIELSGGDDFFAGTVTIGIDTEGLGGGISAGAATHFVFSTPPTATAAVGFPFTITAKDANNLQATSYTGTVQFYTTGSAGTLPANSTLVNGRSPFSATLTTSGNQAISAADTVAATLDGTSSTIAVAGGPAVSFSFTTPANVTSGTGFTFTVTAKDANTNIATGYNGNIAFASSDPWTAVGLPPNSALTSGTGVFSATLWTNGNQTLTATDTLASTLTGSSPSIAVAGIVFVSDNMTDTAGTGITSHTGQIGATWTYIGGFGSGTSFEITNANRVESTTAGGSANFAYASGAPLTPNYSVEADIYYASNAGGYAGIMARSSSSGAGYWAIYNQGDTAWELWNTSGTKIGSYSQTLSAGTTYHIKLLVLGESIRLQVAGVTQIIARDTATTAAGSAGLAGYGSYTNSTGIQVTNLVATNILLSFNVVCDGDSITAGYLLSNPYTQDWPAQTEAALGSAYVFNNFAVSGETVATMTTNAPSTIDPLVSSAYRNNIAVLFGGTNDIYFDADSDDTASTTISRVVAYCQARQAAGWQVVVTTLLPRDDFPGTSTLPATQATHFEARRQAFNTYIRNNWQSFANALADVGNDPNMGQAGDETNATLFTDGVHPTAAGAAIVAGYMQAAILSLTPPNPVVQFAVLSSGSLTAGDSIVFTIIAQNKLGQTITDYTGIVGFTSTDTQATLPSNSTLAAGVGIFTATLKTANSQTITATDTVHTSITGYGAIAVSPAAASAYQWLNVSSLSVGVTGDAVATLNILDAYSNLVTSYSGSATIDGGTDCTGGIEANTQIARPGNRLQNIPQDQVITGGQMILNIQVNVSGTLQLKATDDASVLATTSTSDITIS
jgi:lysophospholipase L1-like esterase